MTHEYSTWTKSKGNSSIVLVILAYRGRLHVVLACSKEAEETESEDMMFAIEAEHR